jgi:hypothetical protein
VGRPLSSDRDDPRVRVSVTLGGGESQVVQEQVEAIAETLIGMAEDIFSPRACSTDPAMAVEFQPS